MNSRHVILTALTALTAALSTGTAASAVVADGKAKEKCYGIAKAGQNDCGKLAGTHSFAGEATVEHAQDQCKFVAKGTCKAAGGKTADEAKAEAKNAASAQPTKSGK